MVQGGDFPKKDTVVVDCYMSGIYSCKFVCYWEVRFNPFLPSPSILLTGLLCPGRKGWVGWRSAESCGHMIRNQARRLPIITRDCLTAWSLCWDSAVSARNIETLHVHWHILLLKFTLLCRCIYALCEFSELLYRRRESSSWWSCLWISVSCTMFQWWYGSPFRLLLLQSATSLRWCLSILYIVLFYLFSTKIWAFLESCNFVKSSDS